MKRNNKKGFTIVELVIVIAVIGILAAVLIPTFSSVIADAQASAAKQEARNGYAICFAEDLKDGNIDGKNDGVEVSYGDGTYSVKSGVATYTVKGADDKYYSYSSADAEADEDEPEDDKVED